MPTIVSDIDGTVLNAGGPNTKVVAYIKSKKASVIFLTNRKESDRKQTVSDLKQVGIKYKQLIMNDSGESAPTFKKRIIKEMIDDGKTVSEFIDDRGDTRKSVKTLGVKVTDPSKIAGKKVESLASYSPSEQTAMVAIAISEIIENLEKVFKQKN